MIITFANQSKRWKNEQTQNVKLGKLPKQLVRLVKIRVHNNLNRSNTLQKSQEIFHDVVSFHNTSRF